MSAPVRRRDQEVPQEPRRADDQNVAFAVTLGGKTYRITYFTLGLGAAAIVGAYLLRGAIKGIVQSGTSTTGRIHNQIKIDKFRM